MAELPITRPRALLPDARGEQRFLRASWHPEDGEFVLSAWEGGRCTKTLRLAAEHALALIELLVDGLAEWDAEPGEAAPAGANGGGARLAGPTH